MADRISETEFEKLVYDNQGLIIKVCNIYCNNQQDKDDLFQDITINLWKGIDSFKGNSKLSTWIYKVSLNTAISKFRKKKKIEFVDIDQIPDIRADSPDKELDNETQIKALNFGISKLKPIEKAVILLYLEENSYDEIADITGMSKSNVSVKLVRIKRKLEKIIGPLIN
jgi:RNA polymerase sigma-70 factor, ECF subfamily